MALILYEIQLRVGNFIRMILAEYLARDVIPSDSMR
jgi:hypothetical protein